METQLTQFFLKFKLWFIISKLLFSNESRKNIFCLDDFVNGCKTGVLLLELQNKENYKFEIFQGSSVLKSVNYDVSCNKQYMDLNVISNRNPDDLIVNVTSSGQYTFTTFKVKINSDFLLSVKDC